MFGLLNAPSYFCKVIVQVLGGLDNFVLPYTDDIGIFVDLGKAYEKHRGGLELS